MSEAKQLLMEVSLDTQKQSFSEAEALNTFRGPQGPRGEPGSIDNLVINGKEAVPVDGKNTISLTPKDVGALPSNGTAKNSEKLGGKAPEYYLQPRNLLDNSYFVNPVNQRGQTSYTSGYGIDRWASWGMTVSIKDGCIELSAGGNCGFSQILAGDYTGKVLTAVLCDADGNVKRTSATVPPKSDTYQYLNIVRLGICSFYLQVSTAGVLSVNLQLMNGGIFRARWVAVYEGTYTADNLPPYVPKGYVTELAECQRYFFQIDTYSPIGNGYSVGSADARIAIVTPVEMRNTPSLNDSFDLTIVGNGVSKTVTSTTVGSKRGNIVRLNIVSSGLTANYVYSAFTGGTGALQLSADL